MGERCDAMFLTCAINQPRMSVKLLVNTTTRKRDCELWNLGSRLWTQAIGTPFFKDSAILGLAWLVPL